MSKCENLLMRQLDGALPIQYQLWCGDRQVGRIVYNFLFVFNAYYIDVNGTEHWLSTQTDLARAHTAVADAWIANEHDMHGKQVT